MTDRVIEGILSDAGFRQTNGSSFAEWLAGHDREVARRALFAAADEFLNGHQGDKPHDNFRTGVPTWLNRYAVEHYDAMPYCAECGCSTPNGAHFSHCRTQDPQSQDSGPGVNPVSKFIERRKTQEPQDTDGTPDYEVSE